ncbi:MAG: hypothetical protein AAGB34_08380 [Planctomycetota bacterium]
MEDPQEHAQKLSDADLDLLIPIALDLQAKAPNGWLHPTNVTKVSAWSELLSIALSDGLFDEAEQTRALQQMLVGWQFQDNSRLLVGDEIQFKTPMFNANLRKIVGARLSFLATIEEVTIDGQPSSLPTKTLRYAPHAEQEFRTNGGGSSRTLVRLSDIIDHNPFPPGDVEFTIRWKLDAWINKGGSNSYGTVNAQKLGTPDAQFTTSANYTYTVFEKPELVTTPRDDPRTLGAIVDAEGSVQMSGSSGLTLDIMIRNQIPWTTQQSIQDQDRVWVVARPTVRAAGREEPLVSSWWSEPPASEFYGKSTGSRNTYGEYPFDLFYDQITLILVPAPDAAVKNDDVHRLWNEPIEIPVKIDWSAIPEKRRPPRHPKNSFSNP